VKTTFAGLPMACCRLYTTDMYSDVTCSLAHSFNCSLNPTSIRQLVRTFAVFMIMYFFIYLFIHYISPTRAQNTTWWSCMGSHVGSPCTLYIYYALYSFLFFLYLYFLLVSYFIRSEPLDFDLRSFISCFSYLSDIDKHEFS